MLATTTHLPVWQQTGASRIHKGMGNGGGWGGKRCTTPSRRRSMDRAKPRAAAQTPPSPALLERKHDQAATQGEKGKREERARRKELPARGGGVGVDKRRRQRGGRESGRHRWGSDRPSVRARAASGGAAAGAVAGAAEADAASASHGDASASGSVNRVAGSLSMSRRRKAPRAGDVAGESGRTSSCDRTAAYMSRTEEARKGARP